MEFQIHLKLQCVMYALQAEPNGIAKIINNYQFVFDERLSYLRKSV